MRIIFYRLSGRNALPEVSVVQTIIPTIPTLRLVAFEADKMEETKVTFIALALINLAIGVVWVRIFSTPLYRFMGRFVENRLKRLMTSGVILVVLLTVATCFLSHSRSPHENIALVVLGSLFIQIPSTFIWIVLEYRYGGTYEDQKKRLIKN